MLGNSPSVSKISVLRQFPVLILLFRQYPVLVIAA
jgi:hypothetical protein